MTAAQWTATLVDERAVWTAAARRPVDPCRPPTAAHRRAIAVWMADLGAAPAVIGHRLDVPAHAVAAFLAYARRCP